MRKILVFLLMISFVFSYSFEELRKIIETNLTKIDNILKSDEAFGLLAKRRYIWIDLI